MITATITILFSGVVVAFYLTGLVALCAGLILRDEGKEIKELEQKHWKH